MTTLKIIDALALIERYAGCGDNSCMFIKPKGMATNGGCRCFERVSDTRQRLLAQALALLYREVKATHDQHVVVGRAVSVKVVAEIKELSVDVDATEERHALVVFRMSAEDARSFAPLLYRGPVELRVAAIEKPRKRTAKVKR